MRLCDYGCGQEGKYQFKNGKWCCHKNHQSCPVIKQKYSEIIQNRTDKEKEEISKKFRGKNNPYYGKKGYWTGKIGPNKGKKRSISSKIKQSKTMKKTQIGDYNNNWKGGYARDNIPQYDRFKKELSLIEKIRRNKTDQNILEIKCAYCGEWCIPKSTEVYERLRSIDNFGDTRLYCSDHCKQECPIYRKVYYSKDHMLATSREVQPELRQMRLKIDNYTCQKCGKHKNELEVGLHCHHIEGILWEPLESADIDKCITFCKDCHIQVHKIEGCNYNDLKCTPDKR